MAAINRYEELLKKLEKEKREEVVRKIYECEEKRIRSGLPIDHCYSIIAEEITKILQSNGNTHMREIIEEEKRKCYQSLSYYGYSENLIRKNCNERILNNFSHL